MNIVFLNGSFIPKEEASVSVMDRGFLFADGIYEVIPVYSGKLFRLDEHLSRLQRSLDAIRLASPFKPDEWQTMLCDLVDKNGGGNQAIYLQVTRGIENIRDHRFPDQVKPTIFAMSNPIAKPSDEDLNHILDNTPGISAITTKDIRWDRCDIKSISLLPNILLRQQALDAGAQEALLIKDGYLTEGAASNCFVIKDGIIYTPPKNELILGGITRDLIIELARKNQIDCKEAPINEEVLNNADEIWVSSSTKEIVPVVKLNHKVVGQGKVGPVWRKMAELYIQYKQSLFET